MIPRRGVFGASSSPRGLSGPCGCRGSDLLRYDADEVTLLTPSGPAAGTDCERLGFLVLAMGMVGIFDSRDVRMAASRSDFLGAAAWLLFGLITFEMGYPLPPVIPMNQSKDL